MKQQLPKGDIPVNPLTDQSFEEYKYPLQTNMNLIETVQSHHSFKPQLFKNQDLYDELIRKAESSNKPEQRQLKWKTNIHLKLNEEYQELQYKKEQLINNYQQQQLQQCSFQPTISNKSKQIGSYFGSSPRYMSPKNVKIAETAPKQKPINKSNKENNSDNSVWERLSKQSHQSRQTPQTNQPQSTRTSQRHTPERVDAISNRLYEDAFQPKKFKFNYNQEVNSPKIITQGSEKHLIRYFVKQFYDSITHARLWTLEHLNENLNKLEFKFEIENDLCLLTVDELAITLDQLGFAPFKTYDHTNQDNIVFKIFRMLQCPQDLDLVLSRNLLSFLLAAQGFQVDFTLVPKYTNNYNIQFPIRYKNILFEFEEGNLLIQNNCNIQKQFNQLYVNHLTYKKQNQKSPEPLVPQAPQPSQQTNDLANKYRSRVQSQITESKPINLNDYDQYYQQKKEQLKQEINQNIKQQCPFSPKINSTQASPKYHLNKKRNITPIQQEELPSFQPNLNKTQHSYFTEAGPAADQREAIKRMVKGRVEKQLNQIIISQGTCYQKKRKNIEQQLYQEEISKLISVPIMIVNVALENNTTKRIPIYSGDQPRKLAEKFIRDHRLDPEYIDQLTDLLEQQLAN